MPFNLTKDEETNISRLSEELSSATSKINSAVVDYNESLQSLRTPVEEAVTEYNIILTQIRDIRNDIVTKALEIFSEKSESWQDSDPGQSIQAWISDWEDIDLDDVDYQWPDELEIDLPDHSKNIDELPVEADSS